MSNLVGKPAPTFGTLLDQDGQPVDSTTFIGKQPLCIFFYPAAMTYGEGTLTRFDMPAEPLSLSQAVIRRRVLLGMLAVDPASAVLPTRMLFAFWGFRRMALKNRSSSP